MPPENNQHGELFKSIGRTLAHRREAKGMTQDQVSEALHIGTEAVSRMERGLTMPTVQRLAELAEIYECGIDELLIASSTRTSDQAELISQILQTLPEADRAMIVEVVQKIAARLKDRL
ncbi:MAG: XRE family transcriptional regulator [Pseudomonas sp.]|uniref:helix-turn-helix domain-containing protein n=1 Tax=Pseudomonas sp. TaxID=306 RepID=UPI001D708477|nr:helix-turn-helix transcriptional regulator [Pseudomonas sp.]MPT00359.1 XRE family transcriptional regulator [Pseudomonas sp.]